MNKFLSRKFLLVVGAVITLLANDQWTEAVATVLGYAGINGAVAIKAGTDVRVGQDDADV